MKGCVKSSAGTALGVLFTLGLLAAVEAAPPGLSASAPLVLTNTTGGKNQDPSVDRGGRVAVFISNVNHAAGVSLPVTGAFDFNGSGNGITPAGATPPNPACPTCMAGDSSAGNVFVWHRRAYGGDAPNTIRQLTFSTSGGFAANRFPDLDSTGRWIAWDSADDHTGDNPEGNREIFLHSLADGSIVQITDTTGGGDAANRYASIADGGAQVVFESTRDLSAAACLRPDGVTACDNADGNSEVYVWDRASGQFTQVTATIGGGSTANSRPRISPEGTVVAFQSTRDFSDALSGGVVCAQLDGGACANDGNAEVMRFDLVSRELLQVTGSANSGSCAGATSSDRVETTRAGKWLVWQSKCEALLNAGDCGSCDGNDEVFLADIARGQVIQVTISEGGFNRVPRIAAGGAWLAFESNRSFLGGNLSHARTLYVLRRSSRPAASGTSRPIQLVEDGALGLTQSPRTIASTVSFTDGFNTAIEILGVSRNGRFVCFDNRKGVGNQEIWLLDRKL